ncbi:hypothetical protein MVEN_02552100 [Mycena venus]|uniref:Uncharacterized protein n=1 Tax=Mycena venus TaxID=2733690 RepID=A0A8H6U2G1_9AGAR|nr:hypothetical protein MVEN_02552100 [Mycena venus]
MAAILNNDLHWTARQVVRGWGFLLRCCSPSPHLLQNLSEIGQRLMEHKYRFFPVDGVDLHNIVQWLKGLEPSPIQLLPSFEHLLEEQYRKAVSMTIDSSFEALEVQWMDWRDEHKEFLDHLTT